MNDFSREQLKDIKILVKFIQVYCQSKHIGAQDLSSIPEKLHKHFPNGSYLCPDCQSFLGYAFEKRAKCPLNPKPSCKHCRIHCYSMEYRQKIREIMSYSGRRLILRGRLDYLWHYFF